MTREERENAIKVIKNYNLSFHRINGIIIWAEEVVNAFDCALEALEQEPKTDKYEYHTDHTDCIWYGSDSGCPVTCSQYRDGWNDAMEYIYKNGKGYQPYKRE